MRASFTLPCSLDHLTGFVAEAVSADTIEITATRQGCSCADRPSESEALTRAAEIFGGRIDQERWAAVGRQEDLR